MIKTGGLPSEDAIALLFIRLEANTQAQDTEQILSHYDTEGTIAFLAN